MASQAFFLAPWHSFWFLGILGAEVDAARVYSLKCCFVALAFTWLLSLPTWGLM
jgi:hypothetical protein